MSQTALKKPHFLQSITTFVHNVVPNIFCDAITWNRLRNGAEFCKKTAERKCLMVTLEKRRSGTEWLSAMLIPTYKQMRLAPVSYGESGLKLLLTFQVWARLFLEVCIFLCLYFFYLLYECVPRDTGRYQTLSRFFNKRNLDIILFIQTGD